MPPLRIERFNDNGRHPNKFIAFIKEHPRSSPSDKTRALGILNRVAAIVYPIMKDNGLQVTTLEEHPFNDSYAGINYNAGECIGLVLRTRNGGWTPESFVVSVMLHELSHITNMHHAAPFWRTLAQYRARMTELRQRGYTGEGFYSRGQTTGGQQEEEIQPEELPRHICGGATRRVRRSRTGRPQKKLKTGVKLGGDLELRKRLDGGKSKATPRIVNSKRGQELRASAAELRFSAQVSQEFEYDEFKDDEDDATRERLSDETKELKQSLLPYKPIKEEKRDMTNSDEIPVKEEIVISDTEDEMPGNGQIDGENTIGVECSVCTLRNETNICAGCGNLLSAREMGWKCRNCPEDYRNPPDSTTCALCGEKPP